MKMRRELMRESWWGTQREKRERRNIKGDRGNNLTNYDSHRYQKENVIYKSSHNAQSKSTRLSNTKKTRPILFFFPSPPFLTLPWLTTLLSSIVPLSLQVFPLAFHHQSHSFLTVSFPLPSSSVLYAPIPFSHTVPSSPHHNSTNLCLSTLPETKSSKKWDSATRSVWADGTHIPGVNSPEGRWGNHY